MTKLVTATAVMQLADDGAVDLDAPAATYYQPFATTRPPSRSEAATVRHLLSHSSGLANPLPLRWVHLATEPGRDRAQFVQELIEKHGRRRFAPGTKAAYPNLGYLVLGEIIRTVSGETYEEHVARRIIEPLGMGHSGFSAQPGEVWATPYQRRRTALDALLPLLLPRKIIGPTTGRFRSLHHFYVDGAAYGGLVGPALDAARFLQVHLADGAPNGTRILSADATRSMRAIVARGRRLEVGLGWYRRGRHPDPDFVEHRHPDFVEHLGGGAGFWNCMRLYPEAGLGIVIMGNATSYDHDVIARTVAAHLRDEGATRRPGTGGG